MSSFKPLAALASCLLFAASAMGATRDQFLYGTSNTGGTTLPFRYFVPPGYDPTQAYPLILFLHGAGERGSDNEAQLNNNANGAMRLLDDANLAQQPVFMIAPQCFTNGWWSGAPLDTAIAIIDQVAADYHIDSDRVYVTGLSMGGMGTWSAVTSQPDRFAAAVPMSGNDNGSPVPASVVAGIPFWFFHAANDGTVNVSGSDNLVTALRNAGASTIYTRYDTGDHPIWQAAYTHPLLFSWLVAQTRGAPSTTAPPLLRVTAPTSDSSWQTEDTTLDLAGSADNGGNTIDAIAWDILAGASGAVTGTTDWSVGSIALNDGVNLIRVTATSPSEHPDYGGHTTFNDSLRASLSGPPPEPGSIVAAINAGGDAYTAVDGTLYVADTAFDGGSTQVSSNPVDATDDDTLYNNWRWGNFAYHLPLVNGPYTVELQFADTYNTAPGQRIFDVAIEGATVLQDFDIIASVGVNVATVRRFDVDIEDGVLDVVFTNGSTGSARIDALRVIRAGGDALFANGFELE
ncbi:MAG: malectin domain-containing carbohydrate-binding protein [Dokdonella sp.]